MNDSPEIRHQAITPIKQSFDASCVAASIVMAFSGFGISVSEQTLVDKYFPSAAWSLSDGVNGVIGVTNADTVRGIVQITKDLGFGDQLQTDVFVPQLHKPIKSAEDKYIVRINSKDLRENAKRFNKGDGEWELFDTLEQLNREGEIGVYTANERILKIQRKYSLSYPPANAIKGFYDELAGFIRKGHIVGPHGGMTMHARALDGRGNEEIAYRPGQEGFLILDPEGGIYPVSIKSLVRVDDSGVFGDTFDYLFRLSPKEVRLNPPAPGFRGFLQNLRQKIR